MSDDNRDFYADGWREGVRQAHLALQQEKSLEIALARLEALMVEDHKYKLARAKRNRGRKADA